MNFMMEPMRSLSLPIAGVEGGRAEFISPEKAMKKRFLVLVAMVALFVLGLTGFAMAADDPITLNMDLSSTRFAGPEEVAVTIRVTNTQDVDMPGPLALYYPNGHMIEEFGTPTLSAGQSKTWEGKWMVTEDQIKAGRIIFAVRYSILSPDGSVTTKQDSYYVSIEDAGAVAQVEIKRYISPTMARNGQKVSVTYEIANTGTLDVTDVVIKEGSTISKTNGKIDLVKAGQKENYTFTVTMGKKDLTSNATITYKAGGKSYTETLGNAKIKYGNVQLTATLKTDKKGGNPGDPLKFTLTLKNTGKTDYQNITVTDPTLGTVFSGLSVEAGKTITQEKEILIAKSTSYQFNITGTTSNGSTIETATDRVTITAVDPDKIVTLLVSVDADKPIVYILPDVVKFTVTVTNNSAADAENVVVSASGMDLYTFEKIPAGKSASFVRDVKIEMAGNFRFDARVTNQLGATETFHSDLFRITHSTPTAAPTQVPIATPEAPTLERIPTDDGLPPYVTTLQNAMSIGQWVFVAIGGICVVLIVIGLVSRVQNAAHSAKASDHLERDGYRDYTQAFSSKHRHVMPDDAELDEYHAMPLKKTAEDELPTEEAPAEEAPVEEAPVDAVSDAMAELYPEATEKAEEITYTRRRRDNSK